MKEAVLVIIKPDAMQKNLFGDIFNEISHLELELIALKLEKPSREKTGQHYRHLSERPFFSHIVDFFVGKLNNVEELIFMVYYGEDAVGRCREIAGATNPEEASPHSLRGRFGRITTKDIFENVLHVSSDAAEAEREIKLWFEPEDLHKNIFLTQEKTISIAKKVWQ